MSTALKSHGYLNKGNDKTYLSYYMEELIIH